jgi:hypothetical protein
MVFASKPVASVMRLAARPVGARSTSLTPFAASMGRMALTIVVLPTPGPPVMTRTLDISASRIAATWLSASASSIRFSTHDPGPWQRAARKAHQALGDGAFRAMQAGEKYAGRFANAVGDHRALLQLEVESSADQFQRHLEQLPGQQDEFVGRQAAMSLVHRLGQRVGDTSADPHHGGLLDAKLHGDGVGGLEADAADVARQAIRVLGNDLDGAGPISLENPYRSTPWLCRNTMISRTAFCSAQAAMMPAARTGPMPSTS